MCVGYVLLFCRKLIGRMFSMQFGVTHFNSWFWKRLWPPKLVGNLWAKEFFIDKFLAAVKNNRDAISTECWNDSRLNTNVELVQSMTFIICRDVSLLTKFQWIKTEPFKMWPLSEMKVISNIFIFFFFWLFKEWLFSLQII